MIIPDETTYSWIEANAKADCAALRLKYAGIEQRMFAILQIECRRKAATKLADTLRCSSFLFPTSLSAEQCTSDALAAFHATLVKGSTVLDMTCGLCIDAFHIAAAGHSVTAIDTNPTVVEAARHNAAALGISDFNAINADSTAWLRDNDATFDTIFIDPARRGEGGKRIFALSDCEPDVIALLPLLRQRCKRLVIKASPMLDVAATIQELGGHCNIYVTGTRTECKEVVAVIDFDSPAEEPLITAVTVGAPSFSFTRRQEHEAEVSIAEPQPGMFIYEPYPAVMKSGAFSGLCEKFGVAKPAPLSHLYLSSEPVAGFPGSGFVILEVLPLSKSSIKEIKSRYSALNVTARNFVMTAPELVKRLKIKEGGTMRLFATTAAGTNTLIIAEPIAGLPN